jgi:glutathione-regulated potassium-efflux system ancillary protein KefC
MNVLLVATAFVFGFAARQIGLPPLVGFLAAGFTLNFFGVEATETLHHLSEIGIILLLFSIGLKVKIKSLLEPLIWGTASLHMVTIVLLFGALVHGLSLAGLSFFSSLDLRSTLIIAFALSFSSTVFAVKILEEKKEISSKHGRLAIGILIIQDMFAVIFITISNGKIPSPMALGLIGLFFLRKPILAILDKSGHGELLVLLSCILPIAGADIFEYVGLKPDLGALILGMLLAGHPKTEELAKAMFGFKDMFLVGFFLTIGMAAPPTLEMVGTALILVLFIPLKAALFFFYLTRFSLRARTSLITAMNLTNYSEFGLIIGALGVSQGWFEGHWLVILAVALSISMMMAPAAINLAIKIYGSKSFFFRKFETKKRLAGDDIIDIGTASVAVYGMGRIGTGAYNTLRQSYGRQVIGIDSDEELVLHHVQKGRKVILGDACDDDFWQRGMTAPRQINLGLLTMSQEANIAAAKKIAAVHGVTTLAAIVQYEDQIAPLKEAGVDLVLDIYAEAGAGFSDHVCRMIDLKKTV